jgi:hypothetical protein
MGKLHWMTMVNHIGLDRRLLIKLNLARRYRFYDEVADIVCT